MTSKKTAATVFQFLVLTIAYLLPHSISIPLSTNSRWIIDDATGNRVKLACVNWASHLEPMIAEGLQKKPLGYIAGRIAATGFNCVRFTWATFMFTRSNFSGVTVAQSLDRYGLQVAKDGIGKNNPQFLNMRVVDVHKAVVNELGRNGLMVVLDNHMSQPSWCCNDNDGSGFFGDYNFDPKEWLRGLIAVARAYKRNPTVIGISLRNELRGSRENERDWYTYMKQGAEAVHTENPALLVIVSGLHTDKDLHFLKTKPLEVNLNNKLVYEAHWYAMGTPPDQWINQTNRICASETQRAQNDFLFLLTGNQPFPLFLGEFGMDQTGAREVDNRFIGCFLATAAETDFDWALWAFQGSYIFRQNRVEMDEHFGVVDFNWDRPRNPLLLNKLQVISQMNQAPKSNKGTSYLLFHPQSGQCVKYGKIGIALGSCKSATWWDHHDEGGPVRLAGRRQCLGAAGDGAAARVSYDCSSNWSKWKTVSASGLHLAAQDEQGKYLCLEKNGSDSTLVTKKCLCVGDDLVDSVTCPDNPQVQWFKFVPTNV